MTRRRGAGEGRARRAPAALALLLAAALSQPAWAAPNIPAPAALHKGPETSLRPPPRPMAEPIPVTRWDFRPESDAWSRAALKALRTHGVPLVRETPRDIAQWCPGYKHAPEPHRRAFWVGFLSALAKHESTWRPQAVGGGGLWYGLLQILPGTARGYGCKARSGEALKDGGLNLSCAVRIMSVTVPRDGVIHARQPRWSGVSADWGPMRSDKKRQEMANWLRSQEYCQIWASPRPAPRPSPEALVWGPLQSQTRPLPRPETLVPDSDDDVLAALEPR